MLLKSTCSKLVCYCHPSYQMRVPLKQRQSFGSPVTTYSWATVALRSLRDSRTKQSLVAGKTKQQEQLNKPYARGRCLLPLLFVFYKYLMHLLELNSCWKPAFTLLRSSTILDGQKCLRGKKRLYSLHMLCL